MRNILLLFILCSVISGKDITLVQDSVKLGNNLILNQKAVRDSKGILHIVSTILKNASINSKEIFYSEQTADSFKNIFITSNPIEDNYPFICIDEKDIVHIAFLEKDSSGLFQLKYTNNSKGKFAEPFFITSGGINKSIPSMAVSKDVVYFLYYTDSYLENGVYCCTYNYKTNKKFTEKFLGAGESGSEVNSSIVCDSKGIVHIIFKSGFKDGGDLKYFSGNGTLKEIATGLTGDIVHPYAFAGNDNKVHIFFERPDNKRLYYSFVKGKELSDPVPVTPEYQNFPGNFDFSMDRQGNLYIVYQCRDFNKNTYYVIHSKNNIFNHPVAVYTSTQKDISDNSVNICSSEKGQIELLISETFKSGGKNKSETYLQSGFIKNHAVINVLEDYLFFPDTRIGETGYKKLTISNKGTTSLEIYNLSSTDVTYNSVLTDTLIIEPDSAKNLMISFSPDDTMTYKSVFRIFSNADNESISNVYLNGKGTGIPYIFNAGDSLLFNSINNFRDSLLIINAGTADLKIDSITVPSFVAITQTPDFYLKPGDSTFIQLFVDTQSPEYSKSFIDSLLIFSNDPYDSTLKVILMGEKNVQTASVAAQNEEFSILHQNYPNPFNPNTIISFTLKNPSHVTLKIYDALAREISELVNNDYASGVHNVTFNGDNLSTGVYYYKIEVKAGGGANKDFVDVRKMILVK